jgi:hypothetical protein
MEKLGFHCKGINLVRQCITTTFFLLLNGSPYGLFRPTRGLRQEDPLSPFLFIMGLEILARMLRKEELNGLPHGIKLSRANPSISLLLFADNTIIFARAKHIEAAVSD